MSERRTRGDCRIRSDARCRERGIGSGCADPLPRCRKPNFEPTEDFMTAIDGFISDSFDRRTLANMEVALERALQRAGADAERHALRAHVAGGILACAKTGDTTLG